jgi:hypothetical protein
MTTTIILFSLLGVSIGIMSLSLIFQFANTILLILRCLSAHKRRLSEEKLLKKLEIKEIIDNPKYIFLEKTKSNHKPKKQKKIKPRKKRHFSFFKNPFRKKVFKTPETHIIRKNKKCLPKTSSTTSSSGSTDKKYEAALSRIVDDKLSDLPSNTPTPAQNITLK